MSTPLHKPTKTNRRLVEVLVAGGTPKRTIAKAMGIAQGTLNKYYSDELELGAEMANARVVKRLYRLIQQGSTPATIFWLKARAGWKEGTDVTKQQSELDAPQYQFERLSEDERRNLRARSIDIAGYVPIVLRRCFPLSRNLTDHRFEPLVYTRTHRFGVD